MTQPKSWRITSAVEAVGLARAWMAGSEATDPNHIEQEVISISFLSPPHIQWAFIVAAMEHAETEDQLRDIAVGPVEHLLGWHGDVYIDKLEVECANSSKFKAMLGSCWQYKMTDEIWMRVRKVRGDAVDD